MHELVLAQRLVSLAGEAVARVRGRRAVRARLLLGELSCVGPSTLAAAFEVTARGTPVEGCALEIDRVPPRLRCRACGAERGGALLEPCPGCGEASAEVLAGREERLESVGVDVEEAPVPAPGGGG